MSAPTDRHGRYLGFCNRCDAGRRFEKYESPNDQAQR